MNRPYTTDERERNYSARTIDDIARFIIHDPERIIQRIFKSNSNQKYQRHQEFLDEFRQSLAEHIFGRLHHHKFSGCDRSLLQWFNGDQDRSFSRWLVSYTRNQTASGKSRYFRDNAERVDHLESLEFSERDELLSCHDAPPEDVRNVSLTDSDVVRWRLTNNHLRFSAFSDTQKGIYLDWFDSSIQRGKKVNVVEFSKQRKLDYRSTVDLIRKVNREMIKLNNEIESQLKNQ